MTINEINDNTNYKDALAVLRRGSFTFAEYLAANKLPLNVVITAFTDKETGKITRYLNVGNKRLQISSNITNEELVDEKGRIDVNSYQFHVVELINRYETTDIEHPVLCYQIHRRPIGEVVMTAKFAALDDTLEQE